MKFLQVSQLSNLRGNQCYLIFIYKKWFAGKQQGEHLISSQIPREFIRQWQSKSSIIEKSLSPLTQIKILQVCQRSNLHWNWCYFIVIYKKWFLCARARRWASRLKNKENLFTIDNKNPHNYEFINFTYANQVFPSLSIFSTRLEYALVRISVSYLFVWLLHYCI